MAVRHQCDHRRRRSLIPVFQFSEAPTYSASADVLLSRQNLAASLNNITDPGLASSDSNRIAQTQANLATAPAVIQLALQSVGLPPPEAGQLAGNSEVKAKPTADILTFSVENNSPAAAVRLVEGIRTELHHLPSDARQRRNRARANQGQRSTSGPALHPGTQ